MSGWRRSNGKRSEYTDQNGVTLAEIEKGSGGWNTRIFPMGVRDREVRADKAARSADEAKATAARMYGRADSGHEFE